MGCTNLACVTNLDGLPMGQGYALELNSPDPAFLRYHATEDMGETNLVIGNGAIMLWVRPRWSSPGQGGCGPGHKSSLIEAGDFSTNALSPFWSLYIDSGGSNLVFASATNGASSNYLTAPVSWVSNSWHLVAISYSCSNSCLFLDGAVAATGQGVCYLPGSDTLATGFLLGSQSNGLCQAKADFSRMSSYDSPVDSSVITVEYQLVGTMFYGVSLSGVGQASSGPD